MPYNPYNHSKDTWGPFRPRPGYHPADPANWWYTPEEAAAAGLYNPFSLPIFENHKEEALKCLEYLRKGSRLYDYDLCCLREHVRRGSFSFADIGTNEKELASLRRYK